MKVLVASCPGNRHLPQALEALLLEGYEVLVCTKTDHIDLASLRYDACIIVTPYEPQALLAAAQKGGKPSYIFCPQGSGRFSGENMPMVADRFSQILGAMDAFSSAEPEQSPGTQETTFAELEWLRREVITTIRDLFICQADHAEYDKYVEATLGKPAPQVHRLVKAS